MLWGGFGFLLPRAETPREEPLALNPSHSNEEQPDHGSVPVGVTPPAPSPNFSAETFTEEPSLLSLREGK